MDKSPDAFRTISEVAGDLDLPQHVLRFWETRFVQIKPLKRGGGRRYYRPDDIDLLKGIRHLLYGEGYTIRGVQRILKDQGIRFVMDVWREGAPQPPPAVGGGRWDTELGFDRRAAEAASEDWAETPEPPVERAPVDHWSEDEEAPEPIAPPQHALAPLAPAPHVPVAPVEPHFDLHDETGAHRFVGSDLLGAPRDAERMADELAPPVEAPSRTPFTIGRATPLDPGFQTRRDPSRPIVFDDGSEADRLALRPNAARLSPDASRPTGESAPRPGSEATPRLRAERIAGFALQNGAAPAAIPTSAPSSMVAPMATPAAQAPAYPSAVPQAHPAMSAQTSQPAPQPTLDPRLDPTPMVSRAPALEPKWTPAVEPPPPAVELPPFTGQARARITGQRPAPEPEPHRSGLGHLFDRLRPAPASSQVPAPAAQPSGWTPSAVERGADRPRGAPALSRDEIRRLQSTLFELLECKRILDQAR